MKPADTMLLLFTVLACLAMASLSLLGEERVDVYYSLTLLTYFVSRTLIPLPHRGRLVAVLEALLLMVFAVIVGYRVYEVLWGEG